MCSSDLHPSVPATDFASFIAYLKANPGKINCGSAGPGSSADLGQMLLARGRFRAAENFLNMIADLAMHAFPQTPIAPLTRV